MVMRLDVVGSADAQRRGLARRQLDFQRLDDLLGDFVLDGENVAHFAIEALGPKMAAAFRLDQLRVDPQPISRAPHASLEDRAHAELARRDADVDRLALVGEA